MSVQTVTDMRGICECGCGQATEPAMHTRRSRGIVKGEPLPFARGHQKHPKPLYEIQDRGYETPCWIWQRGITNRGYGSRSAVRFSSPLAHRQLYEEHVGPIPEGLELDHLCRNRACVNPSHLEPVTHRINVLRAPGCSKMTDEIAAIIRASDEPGVVLAARYEISPSSVCDIRKGRKWA